MKKVIDGKNVVFVMMVNKEECIIKFCEKYSKNGIDHLKNTVKASFKDRNSLLLFCKFICHCNNELIKQNVFEMVSNYYNDINMDKLGLISLSVESGV